MSTRERPVHRARRLADHDRRAIGSEIRQARVLAGLILDSVGRAAGVSPSTAGRAERGDHVAVSHDLLVRLGGVVGLDVRLRSYPSPVGLRDAGHVALIGRFCGRLNPALVFSTERPTPIAGDQRAWDGWIAGLSNGPEGASGMPAEFETRFVDEQGQVRRIHLKLRDSGLDHVLLVVADTDRNRAAIRAASAAFREQFPLATRAVLRALAEGRHPGASGVVII